MRVIADAGKLKYAQQVLAAISAVAFVHSRDSVVFHTCYSLICLQLACASHAP